MATSPFPFPHWTRQRPLSVRPCWAHSPWARPGALPRLTDPDAAQASRHLWKGALFRFVIVGIILFLAVVVLRVNVPALLAGLVLTQLGMIGYWLLRSARTIPK